MSNKIARCDSIRVKWQQHAQCENCSRRSQARDSDQEAEKETKREKERETEKETKREREGQKETECSAVRIDDEALAASAY